MSRFLAEKLSALSPYIPGEQPQDMKYIKLNTNESPYAPCPEVVAAINSRQAKKLRLYSDPELRELTAAISNQYVVGKDMIFCGNGSDEVLSFAFLAWGTDCGAAFPDITYGFYPVFCNLYGIDAKVIPLEQDFSIDTKKYQSCGRMVVLANPNAPTGLTVSVGEIAQLAESNPNQVVVVDEAYIDFGGETVLPLIEDHDNLLIVRTFSKSRQLAGARLGYAMGNPGLIADLNRIKFSFNPYNVNRLTSLAGTRAIQDTEWFESCRKKIISTRIRVIAQLRALGFEVLESRANFVFVRCDAISGSDYYKKLKEKGILVRHFELERINDYVRITIGSDRQMNMLLKKTEEILKEVGK